MRKYQHFPDFYLYRDVENHTSNSLHFSQRWPTFRQPIKSKSNMPRCMCLERSRNVGTALLALKT